MAIKHVIRTKDGGTREVTDAIQVILPGFELQLQSRRCATCGEAKRLTDFHKDRGREDGHSVRCKTCKAISARAYRAKHREEINAYHRAYYQTHKVELAAYGCAYREANKETINARKSAYREAHREEEKARTRAYYKTPRGRAASQAADHRRRLHLDSQELTAVIIREVQAAAGGICVYCGEDFENGHIDHIVPISKSGTNDRSNLVYVCARCNLSKHNKMPAEWMENMNLPYRMGSAGRFGAPEHPNEG